MLRGECARQRHSATRHDLASRCPKLPGWIARTTEATLKQAEAFAAVTRPPVECLFLHAPLQMWVPTSFSTLSRVRAEAATDLLDSKGQARMLVRDHVGPSTPPAKSPPRTTEAQPATSTR